MLVTRQRYRAAWQAQPVVAPPFVLHRLERVAVLHRRRGRCRWSPVGLMHARYRAHRHRGPRLSGSGRGARRDPARDRCAAGAPGTGARGGRGAGHGGGARDGDVDWLPAGGVRTTIGSRRDCPRTPGGRAHGRSLYVGGGDTRLYRPSGPFGRRAGTHFVAGRSDDRRRGGSHRLSYPTQPAAPENPAAAAQ